MASSIAWGSFGAVWFKTKRKQMCLVGGIIFVSKKISKHRVSEEVTNKSCLDIAKHYFPFRTQRFLEGGLLAHAVHDFSPYVVIY
jgi:hypothetical protein